MVKKSAESTESKDSEKTDEPESEPTETEAIEIDSDEREGNDVNSLIGSGAPMIKIRAKVRVQGLEVGETGTFVRTEEIRLQIQNGLAEEVNE